MANYFYKFPKINYTLIDKNELNDVITNVLVRFAVEHNIVNNTLLYFQYNIQDGDTPEIIANKIYNNPERHWAVLLANNIVDIESEWPLTETSLLKYIQGKYTTLEIARTTIHSYYKVETTNITTLYNAITKIKSEIDVVTYNNLIPVSKVLTLKDGNIANINITKEFMTAFEYEVEQNDIKRNIKLFRSEFIPALEIELENVFNETR